MATGPLEAEPGGFVPQAERFVLLAGVLDGVELGAWAGGSLAGRRGLRARNPTPQSAESITLSYL